MALRHEPRCLRPALDMENLQGLADALVDGVRGNPELDRDFLGRQMLIDEQQTVELSLGQSCDWVVTRRLEI